MKRLVVLFILALSLTALLCSCDEGDGFFGGDSSCDHTPVGVPYKEPTCQEAGNRAHYKCEKCGKSFSDQEGKKSLSSDKIVIEKVDHDSFENGFACKYCGIPYANANAYSSEIAFFGVNKNTPEQITGGMAMIMGKGVKKITIYGALTPEQTKALAAGLSGESGDLVIELVDVEEIGGEFNDKAVLPGYVVLKGKLAVFNENGLKYWVTAQKKYSLYLTGDITLTVPSDGGSNWTPIELETHIYGNGYKIKNLRIVDPEYVDWVGCSAGFCYSTKANVSTITDLHLTDVYIRSTEESASVGAICVSVAQGTVIKGCSVDGEIVGVNQVGAIAGTNAGDIIGCVNYAKVTATENAVGGIVGQTWGNVIGCVNYGSVSCTPSEYGGAGGVIGSATNGKLIGCINFGPVSVTGANAVAGGVSYMIPSFVDASANYWQKNGGSAVYGDVENPSNPNAVQIKGSVTLESVVNAINAKLEEMEQSFCLALANDPSSPVSVNFN